MYGKIVLFGSGESCYDSVNTMVSNLKNEFVKLGIVCDEIDVSLPPAQVLKNMEIITDGKYDAAIAFNAVGQQNVSLSGKNIFDLYGIPFYNIILDHPMDHYTNIKSSCENYHIVCIDRDHVAFLKKYFPQLAGAYFIPHAASYDKSSENKDISCRSKDIIFAGTLLSKSCADLLEEYRNYPEPYNTLILHVIDRMLTYRNEDICAAFDYVIHEELKLDISLNEYLDILYRIQISNYFMRTYQREEILSAIVASDIPIHLYGDGMQRLLDSHPGHNAIYHGTVPFSEISKIYSDAKVVLNIMPMFKNGCHERIPFAMLQGSAVLTDPSNYILETFKNCVFTYTYDDNIAERIREILDDEDNLSLTSKNGRDYALNHLTWKHFAQKLLNIIHGKEFQ